MRDILSLLSSIVTELDSLIERLTKSIEGAPKGSIELKTLDGFERFFRYSKEGRRRLYLGKDKEPVIKALSQKKYDQGLLKVALRQRKELGRALESLAKGRGPRTLDDVMATIPESLRRYIAPNPATNEGFIAKWSEPSPKRFYKDDVPKASPYYTMKGEHVRSKSEILIADRLYGRGVPYHYELAFSPNEGVSVVHPDFTVLNTRTLEVFCWEHLGMMDNPDYAASSKEKLEWFASYGIVQGQGLIVTFETARSPLNTKYVDKLIDLYLK